MRRKTAIVTGGSGVIGSGICPVLAREGYDVLLSYHHDADGAARTAQATRQMGGQAVVVQADISNTADIARLFESFDTHFNRLDLLVNNAGITRFAPLLETTEALFDQVVGTDFRGSFFCTQQAAKRMMETGGGVVVNITSNQQTGCWPNSLVYGPTKAALMHFTEAAALHLAPHHIRVVAVAPGYTVRPERMPAPEEPIPSRLPIHRFCTPEEVGEAVAYLASEKAGYITGTCLTLDGGSLLPIVAEYGLQKKPKG